MVQPERTNLSPSPVTRSPPTMGRLLPSLVTGLFVYGPKEAVLQLVLCLRLLVLGP
jgi:hypothetical protein